MKRILIILWTGILLIAAMLLILAYMRHKNSKDPERAAHATAEYIRSARNYAVEKRFDTAIVFPRTENDISGRLICHSLRMCEIRILERKKFQFLRWIPDTDWHHLPEGNEIEWVDLSFQNLDGIPGMSPSKCIVIRTDGFLYGMKPSRLVLKNKEKNAIYELSIRIHGDVKVSKYQPK